MKRVVNIAVSLAVLAVLIWWTDADAVLGHLKGATPGWLTLAALSLTALTFLMAKRWQIIAAAFAIDIRYSRAVAEYYIAQMVNLVLPGGVVGDVARAVRIRHDGDLTRAAQSVAADRIVGQVVLFLVTGMGFTVALLIPGGIAWPMAAWGGVVLGVFAIAVLCLVARHQNATGRFLSLILSRVTDLRLMLLVLLITGLLIFSFYACARATGTMIAPSGWATMIPLILSAMLIPLSVGGWGWREGAAAALFPMIGASPSAGVAAGIAYGAMMLIAATPGLYFALRTTAPHTLKPHRKMDI